MKGTLLYVLTGILIVIILIIVLIVVLKRKKEKLLFKIMQKFRYRKNLIGSTPVLLELSKLEPIIKNEKMEEKYQKWQDEFAYIKDEELPKIDDLLIELDTLIDKKEYNLAKSKISKCEIGLYKSKRTRLIIYLTRLKKLLLVKKSTEI